MSLIITLIIIGIILLVIELLIIPGFGFAGVLGLLAIIGAVVLAFVQLGTTIGLIVLGGTIVVLSVMTAIILRSKTWKKLSLKVNIDAKVDTAPDEKGLAIGMIGVTISRLAPAGKIRINDIDIEARSYDAIIDSGKYVEIIAIEDNKVTVKQVESGNSQQTGQEPDKEDENASPQQ